MNFSKEQENTIERVNQLLETIKDQSRNNLFTLDKATQEATKELATIRKACNHVWNDKGVCYICRKQKED